MKYEACIELAKIYEHRYKQYHSALDYAEMANCVEITHTASARKEIEKRINRLKQKLSQRNK